MLVRSSAIVPLVLLLQLLCGYNTCDAKSLQYEYSHDEQQQQQQRELTGLLSMMDIDVSKIAPDIYYEMHLLVPETIHYRGYECESHEVTTADGYQLTLHRVLARKSARESGVGQEGKPAVFLQHGLMDSSFTWVNNLAHQSLAYILVDKGYDVWLGNSRGNKYSRKHTSLNPDTDTAFWDWDYDQLAALDVAASIDYVLETTGQEKVSWIGHSQGCLVALAGFVNKTIASKVKLFVALAPAARVDHIENQLLKKLAPYATTLEKLLFHFGWKGEFLPNDNLMTWLGGTVCSNVPIICEDLIAFLVGWDSPDMNVTRMPVYFTHFPAGTSGRNIVHYAQAIVDQKFQYFDYGVVENLKKYHSRLPPPYNLTQMSVPVAVFWGDRDKLADPTDVQWLLSQMPNVVLNKKIDNYAHGDFVWGINANKQVYETVLELLQQFN